MNAASKFVCITIAPNELEHYSFTPQQEGLPCREGSVNSNVSLSPSPEVNQNYKLTVNT